MKIVKKIAIKELQEMAENMYGTLVKADVDVAKDVVIVDMAMHADGEAELMAKGSKQNDLWGINLHPAKFGTPDFIEFDSMINIKPTAGNASKNVLDQTVRQKITRLIEELVYE